MNGEKREKHHKPRKGRKKSKNFFWLEKKHFPSILSITFVHISCSFLFLCVESVRSTYHYEIKSFRHFFSVFILKSVTLCVCVSDIIVIMMATRLPLHSIMCVSECDATTNKSTQFFLIIQRTPFRPVDSTDVSEMKAHFVDSGSKHAGLCGDVFYECRVGVTWVIALSFTSARIEASCHQCMGFWFWRQILLIITPIGSKFWRQKQKQNPIHAALFQHSILSLRRVVVILESFYPSNMRSADDPTWLGSEWEKIQHSNRYYSRSILKKTSKLSSYIR